MYVYFIILSLRSKTITEQQYKIKKRENNGKTIKNLKIRSENNRFFLCQLLYG